MVKRSVRVRLTDMLDAIDEIGGMVGQSDLGAYQQDVMMRRAVERCVEIISEASRFIPTELTDLHPSTAWPEIRGIGNKLRHDYQRVSDYLMWTVATKSISELRPVVIDLIARIDDDIEP